MRPRCSYPDTYGDPCEAPGDHEGYTHAQTWEEVHETLQAGWRPYDRDGDFVLGILEGTGVSRGRWWYSHSEADHESYPPPLSDSAIQRESNSSMVVSGLPHSILIPETLPITEEELAEVYRSLGVTE